MKRFSILLLCFLTACQPTEKKKELERGMAVVVPTQEDSKVNGAVTFVETEEGLKVRAILKGVPPGKHGFHIHEFGRIGDHGKDAGGHYNPNDTKHGFIIRDGFNEAHAGDFGNIEADEEGNAKLEIFVPGLSLSNGKYNVAGRAIIVHEKEDDFGQPTGNAGARIGGGPILIVE